MPLFCSTVIRYADEQGPVELLLAGAQVVGVTGHGDRGGDALVPRAGEDDHGHFAAAHAGVAAGGGPGLGVGLGGCPGTRPESPNPRWRPSRCAVPLRRWPGCSEAGPPAGPQSGDRSTVLANSRISATDSTLLSVRLSSGESEKGFSKSTSPSRSSRTMFEWLLAICTRAVCSPA